MMVELTGRTRFRVGKEGFIFKKTVLILEVEEVYTEDIVNVPYTSWRDATLADVTVSRETGKE